MKKMIFAAAIALSTVATPAFAESAQTGTLAVTGTVAAFCDITVTQKNTALGDLKHNSSMQVMVADYNTHCNSPNGFKVVPTSTNNFQLKSSAAFSTPIAYDLTSYAGPQGESQFDDAGFIHNANSAIAAASSSAQGNNNFMRLSTKPVTGALYAGDYSDTITVTITAM